MTSRVEDVDSVLYLEKVWDDYFLRFTVIFIMTMAFFSYCEYMLSLFVYTPLYLVSSFLTQLAQQDAVFAVQKQVSDDLQYIVQDNTAINMNRALLISVTLLAGKYL